jgi:hypothetical protein
MELYRSRLRRPRFTLADVAGLIGAVALAFRWPILLLPTFSVTLYLFCDRLGLSVIWLLILASVVGLVLGLSVPLIVAHRNGRKARCRVTSRIELARTVGRATIPERGMCGLETRIACHQ